MIRTLAIHEFLRTRGMLGVLAGVATAFVAVGTLMVATGLTGVEAMGFIIAFTGLFGLLPVVLLALAIEYWRSAYGRGGYLTQTLPVRGATIYGVRLLYGLVVTVVGLLWMVLAALPLGLITAGRAAPRGVGALEHMLDIVRHVMSVITPGMAVVALLFLVLSTWGYLVQYYFAASIGSESRLAALGPGGPVLVWFILYLVMQAVMFAAIVLIPFGLGGTAGGISIVGIDMLGAMRGGTEVDAMPLGFLPALILITVALIWRTARSWDRNVTLR